jgi:hypothetical protein
MKAVYAVISFVLSLTCMADPCAAQSSANNVLIGTFDGRTPCQELAVHLGEKTTAACIKIKWRLKLYTDAAGNPANYSLEGFVYRKDSIRTGNWQVQKGTATNPAAVVYRLDHSRKPAILLQKADDNIFFFLGADRKIMVGNRDFSYTLNRKPD